MSRHIDLFAVGILVAGIGFFMQASSSVPMESEAASRIVTLTAERFQTLLTRLPLSRFCFTFD